MSEDRAWLMDPIHLERQRRLYEELRTRVDALGDWLTNAHASLARLERDFERLKTRELGMWEANDEP